MPTWLDTQKIKEANPYQKIKRLEMENKNLNDQIAAQESTNQAMENEHKRLLEENANLTNDILAVRSENAQLKQQIDLLYELINKIKTLDDDLLNYVALRLQDARNKEQQFLNKYKTPWGVIMPEPAKTYYKALIEMRTEIERIYNEVNAKYTQKYQNLP